MYSLKEINILFPDKIHFHRRNFNSLFDFIESNNIRHQFISHGDPIKSLYGDYRAQKDLFAKDLKNLSKLDKKNLFKKDFAIGSVPFNLFQITKPEILSFILPSDKRLYCKSKYIDSKTLFNYLYQHHFEDLLLNLAAASYWLKFWYNFIKSQPHDNFFTHACVFSGSLIYSKALQKILSVVRTKVMVFESTFTGNDYFCEEKYQHIANNSDIGSFNYYDSLTSSIDINSIEYQRDKNKAINKLHLSKNKNVQQPKINKPLKIDQSNKTVLILGQVLNDFSLIETPSMYFSSISFYKLLIKEILDKTDFNVIFKAHPWENKKAHMKRPLTLIELKKSFSDKTDDRIFFLEDYNIQNLFSYVDYVVTLCSQAGIEAAFEGLKPFQFGKAFYGQKGFTYDLSSIDNFIELIKQNPSGKLDLAEYNSFELFLVAFFQHHTVSVNKSGIKALEDKFTGIKGINLISAKQALDINKESEWTIRTSEESKKSDSESNSSNKNLTYKQVFSNIKRDPYNSFATTKYRFLRPLKYLFKKS